MSRVGAGFPYSPSFREGSHSRKLAVASSATNMPFMALRAASPRAPAAFFRDIATPDARICYEELQVVVAELPENYSCVALFATSLDRYSLLLIFLVSQTFK